MKTAASCVWWRACFALGGVVTAGCTASADDVRPPSRQLFFPTGVTISPDEHTLFVTNANSELRYDSGSISVITLDAVQAVINAWPAPGTPGRAELARQLGCTVDPDQSETLVCDETMFIDGGASVRIGNFATDIAIEEFPTTGDPPVDHLRVVVPTRGDPSIAWADFSAGKLSCNKSSSDSFGLCDDEHRLTTVGNNAALGSIPDEPFGVFADGAKGFAIVTHLSAGAVTLLDSASGRPAQVVDIKANLFAPEVGTGIRAATGVAGRSPGGDDIVYVGSRTEDRIVTFTVGEVHEVVPVGQNPTQPPAASYLLPGNSFFLDSVGNTTTGSRDTRGIRFSPTQERMYLVNREPPTLQIYDTSLGAAGFPRNALTGASDICREGSNVAVLDPGEGERAYVTCFQDGQIYVVDPEGASRVEDIINVGRGPYAIVAAKGTNSISNMFPSGRKQLFVTNFLEDTIAVIDVTPGSRTRNRVVLRIGVPKAPQ